jgi:subtilase family serine protease
MRSSVRALAGAFSLAFAVVACGGGGSHGASPLPNAPGASAPSSFAVSGFAYARDVVAQAQLVGPAAFSTYAFDVILKMRDPAGLLAYAQSVSDPASGNYRKFLGPTEIADRFAATTADRDAAVAYFRGHGLSVFGHRQRLTLRVSGTQAQLQSAFGTTFGVYRNPNGATFIAPMSAPKLPVSLPVVGSANIVHGLTVNYTSHYAAGAGTNRIFGYSPQQIAAAFDYDGAYAAGYTGAGITVGIIGTGPISTQTSTRLGDLEAFKSFFNVGGSSAITVISAGPGDPVVNGNSGFTTPPPVTGPCTGGTPTQPSATCNPEDVETQIDTEQVGALAKDAAIDYFLSYNPNDGCGGAIGSACAPVGTAGGGSAFQGLFESDEELQTAIDSNTADVLSLSFGSAEVAAAGASPPYSFTPNGNLPPSGLDPMLFAMLAAEGVAVFASAGDSGAQGCAPFAIPGQLDAKCVSYPATDPNVVSVGGVTVPLDSAGRIVGPVTAWGDQTLNGGTGGGVSAYFPQPAFQRGIPGVVGSTRNQPDVSLVADPSTGVAVIVDADGSLGGGARSPGFIGGTSVAAPEMAAMWALVLQACKATPACATAGGAKPYRLGNPNPTLYALSKNAATYASTYLDVTFGNNGIQPVCVTNPTAAGCPTPTPSGAPATPAPPTFDPGYSAGIGYDNVTGLGVPYARALIKAVVGV